LFSFGFSVDVQLVARHFDPEEFRNTGFDLLNARVAKLFDFAAVNQKQVVVLSVEVGFLVVGLVGRELVAPNEPAFEQQVHRIVERRSAHAVVFGLHAGVERLDIEVAVRMA
jgi:hypothetical protein